MLKLKNNKYLSIMVIMGVLFTISPAKALDWWPFSSKGLDYRVEIKGVDDETSNWFKLLQLTEKTEKHPPENLNELEQEAMSIQTRIDQALKAKGYYAAQIEQHIDKTSEPPVIHYQIKPGARTIIQSVELDWQDSKLPVMELDKLKLKTGDYVDAEKVQEDVQALEKSISNDTCLLSLSVKPLLKLNPSTHKAVLSYQISHGPRANFGEVAIKGNKQTKNETIRRMLKWKEGECFNELKINDSQAALFGMQLFSAANITHGEQVNKKGEVPLTVEVTERAARTMKFGANYATDQGFGVKFGWEHRNFSGGAEKVNVDATLAQQEQSLSLSERIPAFRRDDQALTMTTGIKHEDTDAYEAQAFNASVGLERKLAKHLNSGASVAYDLKRTDDVRSGQETYSLFSLPLFAEYDRRDNVQDAKKGIFARANVTPYQDMLDPTLQFLKTTLTGQGYYSVDTTWKPTLAGRISLGSIAGSPYRDLPADLRYYAGGGGSVRGYSYQSLSPYFAGEPVGGGSLAEFSGELRLRFTETIGGVLFLDAGNAYASSLPSFGEKLYLGTGAGARYYSSIGPIRFDVGIPVNGKDIGQTGYAIYVSVGQAF